MCNYFIKKVHKRKDILYSTNAFIKEEINLYFTQKKHIVFVESNFITNGM